MRILVLIVQYPPDVNTSGMLMAQICEGLIERGHEVSVLTTFPHYEKFRVWEQYRGKLVERAAHNGVDVTRLYVYADGNKHKMRNRLLSYLSYNALATVAGSLSRREYDVVLCSNGSFFSGIAASIMGALKHVPFIYNLQDLYPETFVQTGQVNNRFAIKMLEQIERFMYAQATRVSVICPGFRDNLVDKGIPADKVSVIPNFVDTDFIKPLPKPNAFSYEHDLIDKFVVTHAGNLGYVYDLDTLLEVAKRIEATTAIQFLIVGDGVERIRLQVRAAELNLRNVRFLPFQSREMVPLLRATSDVQVALYRRGSGRYSMPSKVYEIMASGRPVLASADSGSDLCDLVTSTFCGICVEPQAPDVLAQALLTLYKDRSLRAVMGERGRDEAVRSYSRDAIVTQYETLCRDVSSGSRAPVVAAPAPADASREAARISI